jgi:predicted DNA-binding transcriptional regulator AlpA
MGGMSTTPTNRLAAPVASRVYHLRDMMSLYGGISDSTIHKWAREGLIPAPGYIGKRPVWNRQEVDAHLAGLTGKP